MAGAGLAVAPEVAAALAGGRPVVALESTLIAHGLPTPHNLQTARRVEAVIRGAGAVPATIAVLGGRLRIGVTEAELERIAAHGAAMPKLSRRDLAVAMATGGNGATTVAATIAGAHLAGIAVFATGGIGGVHRGAETSFDISADLDELARTPVATVCAGAKSILDLPKTLEYLESRGVPVIGYRTDRFPGFYCRSSGLAVPHRVDDPAALAAIIRAQRALGVQAGVVVANPIPPEHALPEAEIEAAIERALAEARAAGIAGKATTPFLLAAIARHTGGRSLAANIALIENNARLAADLAVALSDAAAP